MIPELNPDQLRRPYDPAALAFETTADLTPTSSIIGQPRGVQAIAFGLSMPNPGYNIFVLGESGTGRTTTIQQYVENRAKDEPAPDDWIYVHNFSEPEQPPAIALPAGTAVVFRDAVNTLIHRLRDDIARAFEDQSFRDAVLEVRHILDRRRSEMFDTVQTAARQQGALLNSTADGFQILPLHEDGQPLTSEQYAALNAEAKRAWSDTEHRLQHDINEVVYQAHKLEEAAGEELEALKRRVAADVVDSAATELQTTYAHLPPVVAYLKQLHADIIDHVDDFRGDDDKLSAAENGERFRRYEINVLVDHQNTTQAPVIVELDPTLPRLLGRVEHEARRGGAVTTDFTLIRPGALHIANGGYLVMRARDLFGQPEAWDALKRALVGREVRPDDPASRGGTAVRTLDPAPIPLRLKLLLTGPAGLYYMLHDQDEDFRNLFKVMADFDEEVDRTPANERDYAIFIATRVADEGLLPFDQAAVGRIIEYGSRLAETQSKLSTRFGKIADLAREANYAATQAGHTIVSAGDVDQAMEQREYLANRIETRMRDYVLQGKQLVSCSGTAVGQINGLAVSEIGDHAFGHPNRITARAYVGREGVIHIDREVEMSGPIHDKGVLTLIGYLGGQYALEAPLSLSAQITFEQNYGGIDGDSASSTELYALLSSLSNLPLRQGIAVTGSINQAGEIQAIGGVTEKVEGWFAVCQAIGLDGQQGVLIPAANVDDLMLRLSVVEAVRAGQFHVWAVPTVDEGLQVLTDRPAAEVHDLVQHRLLTLAHALEEFKSGEDEDEE
jgi:lon-related putative ATP-dependent protease